MTSNLDKETEDKIIALYFYLQDACLEICCCVDLMHIVKSFLEKGKYQEYIEELGVIAVLEPIEDKRNAFVSIARVAFHNLIINIFKIAELIKENQRILKYIPRANKGLNEFRKVFWTDDLREYRNKYVAHHSDKDNKNPVPLDDLKGYVARILGLNDSNGKFGIMDFINYAEKFYTKDKEKNKGTITGIIFQAPKEIERLGIDLKRRHSSIQRTNEERSDPVALKGICDVKWDFCGKAHARAGAMKHPPHPGEILKDEVLAPLGLTVAQAAWLLGVPRTVLSRVMRGRAAMHADLAQRLERAGMCTARVWLTLQAKWDRACMANQARARQGDRP